MMGPTPDAATRRLAEARQVLSDIGLGDFAATDRNVLTFLALIGLSPKQTWAQVAPMPIGISPIIEFIRLHYAVNYAPNTRETIRKDAVKPLERVQVLIRNIDDPGRSTNSPQTDYLIDPNLTRALIVFGTENWPAFAARYRARLRLSERGAGKPRVSLPVQLPDGGALTLSPGLHSQLIKAIIEEFTHHFTPLGAVVAYVGDTADNLSLSNQDLLAELRIDLASAPEKPDVILWYPARKWLIYLEAVHSSGHFDEARKERLSTLCPAHNPIYISCFLNRKRVGRAFATIASQTEVWIADEPSHLIHFDGQRFLGPYR